MRYTVEVWADPGVLVDECGADDTALALALRDDAVKLAALRGHRRPCGVVYDNEMDGAVVVEDDV